MNILSGIRNRAGGDYEVGCRQKKDARFERPFFVCNIDEALNS
jgi:hypothetical protein